jgi:hypothetical protein
MEYSNYNEPYYAYIEFIDDDGKRKFVAGFNTRKEARAYAMRANTELTIMEAKMGIPHSR